MRIRVFGLFAIGAFVVAPEALADELKDAAMKVADCQRIIDDASRLKCLDVASLELSAILDSEGRSMSSFSETNVKKEAEEAEKPKWAQAPKSITANKSTDSEVVEQRKPPIWARVLRPDDGSDDDLYPITVVRITKNNRGRIFFYSESGEVWRQTQVRKVTPPKSLPANAVVQKSMTGNPRLSFDDVPNKSYKVRRVN